jgi:NADPH:quinone reductase-like Zn-dependent oxidoreductase
MKAMVIDRYGPPDVLRLAELPKPVPKPDEVLIRLHASAATPSDCAFRSANPFIVRFFAGLTRPKYPVMGDAIAGVVEAVGAEVSRFRPGDRVYGSSDAQFGAYAEHKCVRQDWSIAPMPAGMSFAEAISLSESFLTAMPFLRDEARLQPGQKILVNGASGSVGSMAVQLARAMGAEVTGVCSTRNAELVRSLGADRVIDYTREDFTAVRDGWDAIFDAVGTSSFGRCRAALKAGGVYMTTVPSFHILGTMLTTRRGRGRFGLLATTGLRPAPAKIADLELLNQYWAAGKVRAVIDRHYPLERAAEAHAYVETGRKRGSVILDIAPETAGNAAAPRLPGQGPG